MFSTKFLSFCSWNVEGLRDTLSDTDFLKEIKRFDFVSLMETWLDADYKVNVENYYAFSKCRNKSAKAIRNSGGITVLVKNNLRRGVKFLDKESSEEFVWFKLDKKFFNLQYDVFCCSVYIPPQNSLREKRINIDHFSVLQDKIYNFSKKGKIILCGDFNARVGNLNDYECDDNFVVDGDFHTDFSSTINIGTRGSRDTNTNSYGKSLAELCIGNNFVILNGRTKGDFLGQYTCHTYNGSSVVDYGIVSQSIFPLIKVFKVSGITEVSHHCSISFVLEAEVISQSEEKISLDKHTDKILWNDSLKKDFVKSVGTSECINEMDSLFNSVNEIDKLTSKFTDIIVNNAKHTLSFKTGKCYTKRHERKVKHQKWYDKSCHSLKKELRRLGSLLLKYPKDPFIRHSFFCTKKKYKKLVRKKNVNLLIQC